MRMEAKVYMSHTDLARIQAAAKKQGMTVSGYMRFCALRGADGIGIPQLHSVLDGQRKFADFEPLAGGALEKLGVE